MKHLFITLVAAVFTFGMMVPEAEARRFGGGSSFGMQRQITPPQAPRPAATAPAGQTTQGAAAPARSSWMGPVAGLAAGLGLAALFSHLGLGEEFASFFLIALMVFAGIMLFRMLSRRAMAGADNSRPMQYAGHAPGAFGGNAPASMNEIGSCTATPADDLRSQLDEESFLRQAKLSFIRLQAAHDRGDHEDIRSFTTPEVFAEICMQLNEHPPVAGQQTDVVELDAEVLEVLDDGSRYIVSVRFKGLIREEADAAPAAFDEIWHLVKNVAGSGGWLVAGIQQTA
ncbi:MAG: 39S ribosomal protein L45 [Pseudazoarcus pumilus]|nr:39S ribosomal protein L45 [Pseudazoarcus pumilus]